DAQIDTPTPRSTRFKGHVRMSAPQFIDDPIQIAHMLEPDALWIPSDLLRPPRLAEIAVHIPLDEFDMLLRKQSIERRKHPFSHIFACEIQHKLIAPLCSRAVAKMVHPIGMRAIELTIRIHHLRLDPQAKTHPQRVDPCNQWAQAMWELFGVD